MNDTTEAPDALESHIDPVTGETVMLPPASGNVIEVSPSGQRPPDAEPGLGSGDAGGVGAGGEAGDAPAPSDAPPPPPPPPEPQPARIGESYEASLRERRQQRAIERARERVGRPAEASEGETPEAQSGLYDRAREAIDSGALPEAPSATALQRALGIGNTAARVLRDRLAEEAEASRPAQEATPEPVVAALAQVQQAVEQMEAAPPRSGTLAGGGQRGRQETAAAGRERPRARDILDYMADASGGVVSGVVAATASAFEAGADLADLLDGLTGAAPSAEDLANRPRGRILANVPRPDATDPAQAPGRRIGRAIRGVDPFEQNTAAGDVSRELTQTIVGFLRGARLVKLARVAEGPGVVAQMGRAGLAGMIADAIFQEADEKNIADALEAMGVERNAVTAFLASNPDDTGAEARARNALAGVTTGVALDAMIAVLRGSRAAIAARREAGGTAGAARPAPAPATLADAAGSPANEARDRIIVGDQQRPLVERVAEARTRSDAATEGVDGQVVASQLDYAGQAASRPGPNVFVNWGRIRTPEDVQAAMRDMAEAFRDDIVAAQRGVQSNEETVRLARMMGLTPEELIARQPGQALNAEQAFAARQLYTASGEQLLAAARAAVNGGTLEQAAFQRMMAVHHAIQSSVLGARSEAGRALQQWSIPAGAPAAQMRQIEDLLENTGGADTSQRMARMLASVGAGAQTPEEAMKRIATLSRLGATGRTIEAVHAYWLNAILSDPSTHFFNIIGNSSNMLLTAIERAAEAKVGSAMGLPLGARASAGEAAAMLYGMQAAFMDSLRLAFRTYGDDGAEISALLGRTETPRANAVSTRAIFGRGPAIKAPTRYALGVDPGTGVGRAVDFVGHHIVAAPGRALGAEDAFFKSMLYRAELHALTMRRALGNLTAELGRHPTGEELGAAMARLMRDLPPDLQQEAAESAIYRTFNNSTQISRSLQALMSGDNALINFAVRTVIPFPRTMTNILMYGAERSPIAPLLLRWQEDFAAGGARRATAISRMSVGSGMMLLGYQLAEQGAVVGGGGRTRAERGAAEREGVVPYSVRIGDTYYSFNRLDPMGFILGASADLHDLRTSRDLQGESLEAVNAAERDMMMFVSRALEERSIFSGVSRLFEAISKGSADPLIANVVGPLVAPNIVAGVAMAQDGVLRDARTASERIAQRIPDVGAVLPDGWAEMMRGMQESIMDIRRNTLPRRNLWGEIERRGLTDDSLASGTVNYLTRNQIRQANPNPIDTELQRLRLNLAPVTDIMEVEGVGVNLRQFPQALDRLRELTGNALRLPEYANRGLKDALVDMVEGRGPLGGRYTEAADPERRALILGVRTAYRERARERLLVEFPEVRDHAATLLGSGGRERLRPARDVPGQRNRVLVLPARTAPGEPDADPYTPPPGLPRMR
jgi:hypothetical protein